MSDVYDIFSRLYADNVIIPLWFIKFGQEGYWFPQNADL